VPKFVEFRHELPKTLVGKILRRVLLEEEKTKLAEGDQQHLVARRRMIQPASP